MLIYNVGRRRCTVLVRIFIICYLWTLYIEIIIVITILDVTWYRSIFILRDFNSWAFICSLLFLLLCLAAADSIQFYLLLDHFIHLLCHLTTLQKFFRRNSCAAIVCQHACNVECSEKDCVEHLMLELGDRIFKLDELIAEKSINCLFTLIVRKKDPKGKPKFHGGCWQHWDIGQ